MSKPRPNVPCRFFIIFFVDHNSTLLHIYKVSVYHVCNYFIHYIKIKAAKSNQQKKLSDLAAFDLYNTILTEMCPTYPPSSYHSHSL